MEVAQMSAFVLMYLTWSRLFPSGPGTILTFPLLHRILDNVEGLWWFIYLFMLKFSECLGLYISILLSAIHSQLKNMHFY